MYGAPGMIGEFVLNSVFSALWAGAGLLFRQAAKLELEKDGGQLRSV